MSCGSKKTTTTSTSEEDLTATRLVEQYYAGTLEYNKSHRTSIAHSHSYGSITPPSLGT